MIAFMCDKIIVLFTSYKHMACGTTYSFRPVLPSTSAVVSLPQTLAVPRVNQWNIHLYMLCNGWLDPYALNMFSMTCACSLKGIMLGLRSKHTFIFHAQTAATEQTVVCGPSYSGLAHVEDKGVFPLLDLSLGTLKLRISTLKEK